MGSMQDAILAELREHGGAMWTDEMETMRRRGTANRAVSSLVRYGIVRRVGVRREQGIGNPVRVRLELIE